MAFLAHTQSRPWRALHTEVTVDLESDVLVNAAHAHGGAKSGETRQRHMRADLVLLLLTLIWGSTFVMVKNAVAVVPPFTFLALRFGLAFLTMALVLVARRRYLTRHTVAAGMAMGLALLFGYGFQTAGIQYTAAGVSAFITGLSVVIVPVLAYPLLRQRPTAGVLLGIILATVGLGLLSLNEDLQLGYGELLTIGCAVCFALHIVLINRFAPSGDLLVLVAVQLLVASLGALLLAGGMESVVLPIPLFVLGAALFLALAATVFTTVMQMRLQPLTTATHAALIYTAEPVFGAIFAYLLLGEVLSLRGLAGCALILGGMLAAELA